MAFLRLTVLAGGELRSQLVNTDHVQRVLIDGGDHTVIELTGGRVQRVEEAFEDIAAALHETPFATAQAKPTRTHAERSD